jgi:hypothetical protein
MSKDITNLARYTEVRTGSKERAKELKLSTLLPSKRSQNYTKMNPIQLIDEAEADSKKSGREKGNPQNS